MPVGILVALKTFEDVIATVVASLSRCSCRPDGANTAAAQEHDQRFGIDLALEFGQKVRVACAAGVLIPLDFNGTGYASNPVPFGAGAHVDKPRAGGEAQQVACFLRCQFALIRALQGLATSLGQAEYLG